MSEPAVRAADNLPTPPNDQDAEESVLGAILVADAPVGVVAEILKPGDFYRGSHGLIYETALGLFNQGEPTDAIAVVNALHKAGELEKAGGRERIHELASLVPATKNVGHYARIVREMATLRHGITVGNEISRMFWERGGDADLLVDRAERLMFDLAVGEPQRGADRLHEPLVEQFHRMKRLEESGQDIVGVPVGLHSLDRVTCGFEPGQLVLVAARPSVGKSALAIGAIRHIGCDLNQPVGLFSLEMSKAEVTQRLLAQQANVDSHKLRTGRKKTQDEWARLIAAANSLEKAPIYVDDTASVTMAQLRSVARRLRAREPELALLVVDYLQLMIPDTDRGRTRNDEVSQISRALKLLARDLEIPVLALSQLTRANERENRPPKLHDLRDSGSLEQDSDIVILLHKPPAGEVEPDPGVTANVAKNRNGPTGETTLGWIKDRAKFTELAA